MWIWSYCLNVYRATFEFIWNLKFARFGKKCYIASNRTKIHWTYQFVLSITFWYIHENGAYFEENFVSIANFSVAYTHLHHENSKKIELYQSTVACVLISLYHYYHSYLHVKKMINKRLNRIMYVRYCIIWWIRHNEKYKRIWMHMIFVE